MKNAIFICGPTAIGKTSVAIEVANWLGCEIISFDSRQFFKELQIGAAPPSASELQKVKHHLIGHLSVSNEYNAGDFEEEALQKLKELYLTNDYVVMVGGSGMYMKALTDGFDDIPNADETIRNELNLLFKNLGLPSLLEELKMKDPDYYKIVDQNNPQRIIRALEVIRTTGKSFTSFRKGKKANRYFRTLKIGLKLPREELYNRINRRVDTMIEEGLKQEAKALVTYQSSNALQTVGYKEWWPYFESEVSLEETIEEIKKNTRRYAKRQMTWFNRDSEVNWFSPKELEAIKEYLSQSL